MLLSISGSGVFVSEGFALALARKLRDSIVSVQSDAPLQVAGVKSAPGNKGVGEHELSLGVVRGLSSFGVMKAAAGATIYSIGNFHY